MVDPRTPILVGCGQTADHAGSDTTRSPFDLIAQAGRLALRDGGGDGLRASIDTVAMLRLFSDTSYRFATKLGTSTNPPKSIARRLGIEAARHIYTYNGGNMPQSLVSSFAQAIAGGEIRSALMVGGEALRTQHALERAGKADVWNEDPGGAPELVGDPRRGWSDLEERHQMRAAIVMYPLLENAIRGSLRRGVGEHLRSMAALFARFAWVAAGNPLAARREPLSAERLAAVDSDNRWIGFPYPRLLNANAFVDQAAALIMTSVGEARRLGIGQEKWIYLHGHAEANDHWFVSERAQLHTSPALRACAQAALDMAGKTLADIRYFDLYSCFPAAVEIACREIGLAEDDPRELTVTGGLAYFGGPGNSYVVHSIAEMMRRLRTAPGSFGMVSAMGNYVTKHSVGIYSTAPVLQPSCHADLGALQADLDRLPKAPLVERATGAATIETYTVMHDKQGPQYAVVLGRLTETGQRFVANTPADPQTLASLQDRESLGRPGRVRHEQDRNLFVPAAWKSGPRSTSFFAI
jgi:acetyl-CoA C-acetyltransferase